MIVVSKWTVWISFIVLINILTPRCWEIHIISQKQHTSIILCRVLQGLTIDVIGTCAFGIEPNFQKNRDTDPFIRRCQRLFTDFAKRPFIVILGGKIYDLFSSWIWLIKKNAPHRFGFIFFELVEIVIVLVFLLRGCELMLASLIIYFCDVT